MGIRNSFSLIDITIYCTRLNGFYEYRVIFFTQYIIQINFLIKFFFSLILPNAVLWITIF